MRIHVSLATPLLFFAMLSTFAYGASLANKKFVDMDSLDASNVVRSVGCTKVTTEQLNYPHRVASIFTCQKNTGLPANLRITFRMEGTEKDKTSFTLTWTAPAISIPPDKDTAERAVRRVLEAVGIADASLPVMEFLRDVPMTGDTYDRAFMIGSRKIMISRSACDGSHEFECHDLAVSD